MELLFVTLQVLCVDINFQTKHLELCLCATVVTVEKLLSTIEWPYLTLQRVPVSNL